MKGNHYIIKTVQDMLDCTNEENIDDFLIDLKSVLTYAHMMRAFAEEAGLPPSSIKLPCFEWIDDSNHRILIDIKSEHNQDKHDHDKND